MEEAAHYSLTSAMQELAQHHTSSVNSKPARGYSPFPYLHSWNRNEEGLLHASQTQALSISSRQLRIICRGLAVSLMANVMLVSATLGNATSVRASQATADQKGSEHDVKTMVEQAAKLQSEGKYREATAIWRRILTMAENALGPNHPNVATSLNYLSGLLNNQGQYAEAEQLNRRALAIDEKAFGPNHRRVALTLNNLALVLHLQGRINAAAPLYRRSLSIIKNNLGPDDPELPPILNNLADLLRILGQYTEAELLCRQSLAIRETKLGPDHLRVTESLNCMAAVLYAQGKFSRAASLYRRSLVIVENNLHPDHPIVATKLNNLAVLLKTQGRYAEALKLYRRSLDISEKSLGADHPEVAASLNNLSSVLTAQGQYAEAERLIRRALAIEEKSLGADHIDVTMSLNHLANLLSKQGQHSTAELLARRSLAIKEKVFGLHHPNVVGGLNTLGVYLTKQGRYAEAERLYRRALASLEKSLGADHPDVADCLNNLAMVLNDQRQYSTAELLARRSLAIYEKVFGLHHPNVAEGLNNLATILHNQGQYTAAERLIRRTLAILEKSLGADHLDVAMGLNNLVMLLNYKGQYSSAINILVRSTSIELAWLSRELPLLPDQARSTQLRQLGDAWVWSFRFIHSYPSAAQLALDTRLNRHGLLPEIEQRQALLLNAPGVDHSKVEQLQALTEQLASVSLPPERRAALQQQKNTLQAQIYRQIPELEIQPIAPSAVAKALPADAALVEFQRYQPCDGRKPNCQRLGAPQYIALVLKPNGSITPVQLGPAASIDSLVHKVLGSSAQNQSDAETNLALLSKQVLKPLLPQLRGSRQWFLSPDGELNRVPFAALPSPQQPTIPLAQAVQLRLLTTGRDLVRLQQPAAPSRQALVIANPSFNRPSARSAPSPITDASPDRTRRRSSELGTGQWTPLPGSEREGLQVAGLLSTNMISGPAATTTALQRQQGPRVLHIATHGFFVADQNAPSTDPLRAVQEQTQQLQALRQEDPQLRSGLVFAGANQPDSDPNDDGYLTAAEAVTLNLKGTELVVLSACSTGQGDVRTGEGVYGLQRSLTVAGARTTLLSLWKVDDAATATFMQRFYQRLKANENRSDALAAVQQEFRNGTAGNGQWKEPYYWAAWQLVGDWRPIKGL